MCTAITLKTIDNIHFFGRNMDLEGDFYQAPRLTPRRYAFKNIVTGEINKTKYAVLGMGTILESHPLYADAVNESGLACAGLNFPGLSHYSEDIVEGKVNLGPHDMILTILGSFENVDQVKKWVEGINIVNRPFKEGMYIPTLHWIVADKSGNSIVIESTYNGLKVYNSSPLGILTNTPSYEYHLMNLNQYVSLRPTQPTSTTWCNVDINPLAVGLGSLGLPGDLSSVSRFVKASYLKANIGQIKNVNECISSFYHILSSVAMVGNSVLNSQGKGEITVYTSCMNLNDSIYYYNTYKGNTINSIDIKKEDLNTNRIKTFKYIDHLIVNNQN